MTMTMTVTTTDKNKNHNNDNNNDNNNNDNKIDDSSSKLSSVHEVGACAVCHCALDYSDAAAFSPPARHEDYSDDDSDSDSGEDSDGGDNTGNDENDDENKEETGNNKNGDDGTSSSTSEYIYRKDDPYLPKVGNAIPTTATTKITTMTNELNNKDSIIPIIYQPNNALVYCDTCHRWYHQMCHFVPIYVLPSSAFTCLLCQYQMEQQKKTGQKQKLKQRTTSKPQTTKKSKKDLVATVEYPIQSMFQSPPKTNHRHQNHPILYYESLWEKDPVVILKKSKGLSDQLQTLVRRITHTTMANLRRTKGTIDTYLFQSSQHTRNYHLGIKSLSSTTMNSATSKSLGKKNAKSNHQLYLSQELVQCIVGYTTAKYTIRTLLQSLEFSRNTPLQRQSWAALIAWCTSDDNNTEHDADAADRLRSKLDFVQRIIFPFGNEHERRWVPLTPEYPLDYPNLHHSATTPTHVPASSVAVPSEIHIRSANRNSTHNEQTIKLSTKTVKNGVYSERTTSPSRRKNSHHDKNDKTKKTKKNSNLNKNDNNDDDSGISLHDLKCCVCFCGDCSDENDLLMCDGQNCYRAFHMRCLYPPVENVDENDDSDWFCPYCQTIAELLLKVQTETNRILRHDDDDEWERRRYIRYQQQRKAAKIHNSTKKRNSTFTNDAMPLTTTDDNDDNDSLKSWEDIDQDVFPEAEWEYSVAQRLKKQRGLRNHLDTEILLARIQGQDEQRVIAMYQRQQHGDDHQDPTADNNIYDDDDDDDDDDNLDVDGNFDMYSYQEERRLSRADHDDEDDDTNSQVTLAELSVVELNVSDDELAALTDIESDDDDDTEGDNKETSADQSLHQRRRQSRRLRDKQDKPTNTMVRKKNKNGIHSEKFSDNDDTGRMDVANIIVGKRQRSQIDYRKLNDTLFHAIPASELDDDDDFIYTDPHHEQQQKEHSSTAKTHKANTATTANNNNTNHKNAKKTTALARRKSTPSAKSSKVPPKRLRR